MKGPKMSYTSCSYTLFFISFGTNGSFFSSIVEYRKDFDNRLLTPKENMVVMMTLLLRSRFCRLSRSTRVRDRKRVVVVPRAPAPAIVRWVRSWKFRSCDYFRNWP